MKKLTGFRVINKKDAYRAKDLAAKYYLLDEPLGPKPKAPA